MTSEQMEILKKIEKDFGVSIGGIIQEVAFDSSQFYIVYDGDMDGASKLTEKIESAYPVFSFNEPFDDGFAVTIYFEFLKEVENGSNDCK